MRSLSNSFLRSRVLWRFLAVAGILIVPLPSLSSPRSTSEIPSDSLTTFAIAQAETDSETPPDANGAAAETNPEAADEAINLQLGDTDPRVPEIQRLLGIAGYYEGDPTGIFDISTDLAVSRFQESHSLDPTGIVDSTTWERLQSLDTSSGNSGTTSNPKDSPSQTSKTTSSPPKERSGGFSKLMLWLSLLIVTIGVVGMVFYWLLRLFEGGNPDADTDDFDELPPDTHLDLFSGDSGQHTTESQPSEQTLEPATPPTTPNPILATPEVQPSTLPTVSPADIPTPIPSPEPQPIPAQIAPPTPTPPPQPSHPSITPLIASPEPSQTPDVSISMASLPVTSPAPMVTSLSSANSAVDSALSSEIVTTKVSVMEHLLQDLHHPEPSQRKKAIWELGRRGDSRAIRPLVDLMLQSDSQQRSLILAVLAEISTRTLEPMQQALALSFQDDSPEVRKNALRDLTRIFDSMSQMGYFISNGVHDRDPSVRETAKWAMTQLERIRSSAGLDHQLPDDRQSPPP